MQKSFTLVELLVVTGIIILLSALVLPNYRAGEQNLALQRSAYKLAQDLRGALELSMSAKSYDCPVGEKMKGYGINLTAGNDYYYLKARCDEETSPGPPYDDKTIGTKIYLEKGVKILSTNSSNIFFYPPDPEIDLGGVDTVSVTLCLKTDTSKTKTITINKTGLINVE